METDFDCSASGNLSNLMFSAKVDFQIITLATIVATFISLLFTLLCLLVSTKSKLKSLMNPLWIIFILVVHISPSIPFGYYTLIVVDESLVEKHYGNVRFRLGRVTNNKLI